MVVPTRQRLVDVSVDLLRRQGYAATGVKQILAGAAAPFGSLYHHFPGGKEALAAEALAVAGDGYRLLVEAVLDGGGPDPVAAVEQMFVVAGEHLEASGWADACPIATVSLEVASTSEPLRATCASIFTSWIDALTGRFTPIVGDERAARALALQVLNLLEGAFVFARTLRSTEPLAAAGAAAATLVRVAQQAP